MGVGKSCPNDPRNKNTDWTPKNLKRSPEKRRKKKTGAGRIFLMKSAEANRTDGNKFLLTKRLLKKIYTVLFRRFGPQGWWPAETRFEVMVGAILTQNTNWGNVEKAIRNLKAQKILTPERLRRLKRSSLARAIKPAGYYHIKAKRLKNFLVYFQKQYDSSVNKMKRASLSGVRQGLLSVNGIGEETADSIILYALGKPIFVVDAYTQRILSRHGLIKPHADYESTQKLFMDSLKEDTRMFNEYHALLVFIGKEFCRAKPCCEKCPLNQAVLFTTSDKSL